MPKYEYDKLQRASYILLTIFREGTVIGNITLPEDDPDIKKWEDAILMMNPLENKKI